MRSERLWLGGPVPSSLSGYEAEFSSSSSVSLHAGAASPKSERSQQGWGRVPQEGLSEQVTQGGPCRYLVLGWPWSLGASKGSGPQEVM